MYVLGLGKFKCYPAEFSCVSRSIDICTVAIKNTRNMTLFQPINLQIFCISTIIQTIILTNF